ncbi:DUF1990 family protein [Microbacterium sp. No. 7]|uniref:DUF1990 family protein n=1 Tax=Microbacterium sp. No. 7 TaxID=1714373 RepID=UPI0006D29BBA|nr:DUF1990 family protein [Microbacterium sp. No. 7]
MRLPPYPRGITRGPLTAVPAGLRAAECSVRVAPSAAPAVAALISSWEFKRRAGFETPAGAPEPGAEGVLATRLGGIRFAEPVRVVWAGEHGFGYETRPGHPLYGEESFAIDEDGVFTARSVSVPSTPFWRLGTPAIRLLQRDVFRRYQRIVRETAACAR